MTKPLDITYTPVPSAIKFHADDSPVRGIKGPFGCYSCDTEFLTPSGWKRFDQYEFPDQVAQVNPGTLNITFCQPEKYIKEECSDMIHFKTGKGINQMLSPEHKCLYVTRKGKKKVSTAQDILDKNMNTKVGFDSYFYCAGNLDVSRTGMDMNDAELRVVVAVIADGHFTNYNGGYHCVVRLRKIRKIKRLKMLLESASIPFSCNEIPDKNACINLSFYCPVRAKDFSGFWGSKKSQLHVIVDEVKYWDSHIKKNGAFSFSTTIKESADFIQYACVVTNQRAYLSVSDRRNTGRPIEYRVQVVAKFTNMVSLDGGPTNRIRNTSFKKSPDGFKYCFTVPTGFLLTRRNGCVVVSGNSGKSVCCLMEIILRANAQEPWENVRRTKFAVIRETYPQLTKTTLATFMQWFPHTPGTIDYKMSPPIGCKMKYMLADKTIVECEIIFMPLANDMDVENLKSLELTGAFINEAKGVPKSALDTLTGRINRYPAKMQGGSSWSGIWMDTNPPDDDHWWYTLAEKDRPEGYSFYDQPPALVRIGDYYFANDGRYEGIDAAENICNLGIGFEYYFNMVPGKDYEWCKVNIEGRYGSVYTGKAVYSSYNDMIHLAPEELFPTYGRPVTLGFDYSGILGNACVFVQLGANGQLRVLDEILSKDLNFTDFISQLVKPMIARKYAGHTMNSFGDSSAPRNNESGKTALDILKESGIHTIRAVSNELLRRTEAVASYLNRMVGAGEPSFLLSQSCPILRKGFNGAYHLQKINSVNSEGVVTYKTTPAKTDASHPHDALQYACLMLQPHGVKGRPQKIKSQKPRRTVF